MSNVLSFKEKQVAAQNAVNMNMRKDIRNLKTLLEAVKELEAEAATEQGGLDIGHRLNNMYAALLCQCQAVVENEQKVAEVIPFKKVG